MVTRRTYTLTRDEKLFVQGAARSPRGLPSTAITPYNRALPRPRKEWKPFKITASSQDGTDKGWIYSGSEVEKTSPGRKGWTVKSGGVTTDKLYNTVEDMNGETGVFGNGSNSDDFEGTEDIGPAPTDLIVWAKRVTVSDGEGGTVTEWWFSYENPEIGDPCEEGEGE